VRFLTTKAEKAEEAEEEFICVNSETVAELRRTEGEDKVSSKSFKLRRSDMSVAAN